MGRAGAWALAARPRTLTAAAAPVAAGCGVAAADGVFARGPALAALVGALLIQIATNLANDYYDFVKGSDTEDRVGPVRATQAGLLAPESVRRGAIATLGLATVVGAYLAAVAGWPVVVVGIAALVCAVAYTGGPWPLAYHGLGDLFVFVFFGPVAVAGAYYVQARAVSADALLAGVGIGAFSTAILVANNMRDRETDAAAGKRTLAVRLGDRGTAAQYLACLGAATAAPVAGWAWGDWPAWTLLAAAGVVACGPAAAVVVRFAEAAGSEGDRRGSRTGDSETAGSEVADSETADLADAKAARGPDRRALAPVLERTARGVAIYGLGLATGFLVGAR